MKVPPHDYSPRVAHVKWLLDSDPSIRWQVRRDLTDATAQHSRVATEGWGVAFQNLTNGFGANEIRRFRSLEQAGNEYLSGRVLDRLVSRELTEFHPLHYFGVFGAETRIVFPCTPCGDTVGRPACTSSRHCF